MRSIKPNGKLYNKADNLLNDNYYWLSTANRLMQLNYSIQVCHLIHLLNNAIQHLHLHYRPSIKVANRFIEYDKAIGKRHRTQNS